MVTFGSKSVSLSMQITVDGRRWGSTLVWPHQLTSDLKRCLLVCKCLCWSSLKAISVPTSVIGGLRGFTATSALVRCMCVWVCASLWSLWGADQMSHGQQLPTSGWVWGRYRYFLLLRKVEAPAPDRALAAERPNTGMSRAMRTAWSTIECEETFEFCVSVCWCFLLFQNRSQARAACRVFKADVLRESKKIDMVPGQWDRRSKLAAVSHRSRTARESSTWETGKIGRRRRIHTEMTKTITIIDTRIRIHTSTSRRVKVKSTCGGPPPIDNVCVDPVPVYMVALPRHSADLLAVWGPLAGLKHSVASSSG